MHQQRAYLNSFQSSSSSTATKTMYNSRHNNVSLSTSTSSSLGSIGLGQISSKINNNTNHRNQVSPICVTQFINAAIQNDVHLINTYHQNMNIPVDVVDKNGYTALIYASRNGNVNVVRRLVELNANVDYQEPTTFSTALHYAAQCGHTRTAEVLIKIGKANKEILNQSGKTPFELAKDFGHGNNKIMKSLFFDLVDRESLGSLFSKDERGSSSSLDSGLSHDHLVKNDFDMNNNDNSSQESLFKTGKNSNQNKFSSKKNISYLPCPMMLERFAQYGCYRLIGEGFGFHLLAKNGPTQQMVYEAFVNLSIPMTDIDCLLNTLNQIVKDLETNNKFTLKEFEAFDPNNPDHQQINNLFAYNVWRKDNIDKVIKMINYLQQWKSYIQHSNY